MPSYYTLNPSDLFIEKPGSDFETSVIAIMKATYSPSSVKNMIGTEDDIKEGTDFIFGNMRFDPTLNFSNKTYMPYIADTKIPATRLHTFQMGIRHGNSNRRSYHGFKEPVLVIGLDMTPSEYHRYENEIENNLKKHMKDLIMKAADVMDDYTTIDPKERLELFDMPLKRNPNYKQPPNLEQRYKMIANIRRKFEDMEDSQEEKGITS